MEVYEGQIVVVGLSQAKRMKRRFDAVITLEDPACRPADKLRFHRHPAPPHLVLAFEDVDDAALGIQVATREQVKKAILFGREHQSSALLVHCFHGVGRSAATALAIFADRLAPGHERHALDQLLAIRPSATPNLVIVAHADDILNSKGKLVETVAEWEAGVPEIREKREARLRLIKSRPDLFTWA